MAVKRVARFLLDNPIARIARFKKHAEAVKRLSPANQAIFHGRTVAGLHRRMTRNLHGVPKDPTGKKGLALILAARKLKSRIR